MLASGIALAVRLACALCMLIAPASVSAQTVQPSSAREGLVHLFTRHFGRPGDATVDYLGQLLAHAIDTTPLGPIPLSPITELGREPSWTLSIGYQRLRFRTFEGVEFESGEMSSFSGGLARTPVTYVTTAALSADVATVIAAATVSPRLSVNLRMPIVHLRMSGELQSIEDRGTRFEEFAAPPLRVLQSDFSGPGDVTTAVRWQLLARERVQVFGLGGIRWPIADRENLIGMRHVVPEAGVLASLAGPRAFTFDVALSFAKGSGTELGVFDVPPLSGPIVTRAAALDTWAYGATGAWVAHARVLIRGNVALRTLLDGVRYEYGAVPSASAVQSQSRFQPRAAALTTGSAGIGVVLHVFGSTYATLALTLPVTRNTGMQPGVTPSIGLQLGR